MKAATRAEPSLSVLTNILGAAGEKVKRHLVLQSISDVLELAGVAIVPYYVFEEDISDKLALNLNPVSGAGPVVPGFLAEAEVERLCLKPECRDLALDIDKLRDNGCRCFALKQGPEVLAYMLCNFRECDSRLLAFPLKEDEVYLTGAFTFPAHRGKNLAAVMEYELYKHLSAMGRRRYHSINLLLNAPSLKFKEKLRSRPVRLCLYLGLFGKFHRDITLRRYGKRAAHG